VFSSLLHGLRATRSHPRRRPAFRLTCEALEDRLTPASLLWTNATGNGLWGTALN
jgi:hypothetical protein